MRLREVIDEYCSLEPLDIKGMLREAGKTVEVVQMEDMLRDMDFISAEFDCIKKESSDVLAVARKLKKKIDKHEMDDEQFCRLSEKAERLTQQMDSHGRALHLMGEQNYALELYMMKYDVAAIDEIEEVDRKIEQQVERATVYYPSVARAAGEFKSPWIGLSID